MWKRDLLLRLVFLLQGTIEFLASAKSLEEALQEFAPNTTAIVLPNESLTGTIPSFIGLEFAQLTHLNVRSNMLSGSIPTELGALQQLTFINVRSNKLSGFIPTELGSLQQLEWVFLNDNRLTGGIPTQLGSLAQAKEINLNNNRLTGGIPTQVGNLGLKFRRLRLANNKLTGKLPIQLSQIPRQDKQVYLANNYFDINCEPGFLEWYIPFSDNVVDKYDFSLQCIGQIYPFHLNASSFVSEPQESIESSNLGVFTGSKSVTFIWTHPTISNIEHFDVSTSVNPLGNSAANAFKDCEVYSDEFYLDQLIELGPFVFYDVGFEITVLKQDENGFRIVDIRHCINAADLEINEVTFQYSLDNLLSPATEYNVIVRPFNIYISRLNEAGGNTKTKKTFIFGPSSVSIPFKTKDDIPGAAPVNVRSLSARDDQIDLTWDTTPALISRGVITEYEVYSIKDNKNYTTEIRQISITGLEPNTEYSYQVRAKTSVGGFSKFYSSIITTQTCPFAMKRDDGVTCFATRGSFTVSESEALKCKVEVPNIVSDCETQERFTVQTLNILEGFWRPNINAFREIKKCPMPEYCLKGEASDNSSILADVRLAEPESLQCSNFHRGVYCSSCVEGHVMSSNDGCTKCTDDIKSNHEESVKWFALIVILLILCCVFYFVSTAVGGCTKSDRCSKCLNIGSKYDLEEISNFIYGLLEVKLRIYGGFLQVMFAFKSILYIDASANFLIVQSIGDVSNLNLGALLYTLEVHCAIDVDHYLRLLLYTLIPFCLAFLLLLSYRILSLVNRLKRKNWRKRLNAASFDIFLIVSFLIYPGASRVIFDTFFCEEFETVENDSEFIFQTALRSDYRLSCSFASNGRIGWMIYAACMVLVYPVGILMIYLYFLYQDKYTDLIKGLVNPYKSNRHWFEAYELVRKLLQTTLVSFCLMFGDQYAESVALNLSVFFLVALVYLNPYKKYTNFGFAIVSLIALIFATQLNYWYDTVENQAELKGDAIEALLLFETVALVLVTVIEYKCSKDDKLAVVDKGRTLHIELENDDTLDLKKENIELIQMMNEKFQELDEQIHALKEKNDEKSNENALLKYQVDSLKQELFGYRSYFKMR